MLIRAKKVLVLPPIKRVEIAQTNTYNTAMYEDILNLPEETGRLGTMVAVSDLIEEVETLDAARAVKEAELLELRAQTAELFGSALEEAGHDEEAVTAAKAAWLRDPETAAQAIAGCSIEEAVRAAGCNQYKHKPGCPQADGGSAGDVVNYGDGEAKLKNKEAIKKNFEKLRQEVYDIEDEFMKYSNLIKKHGPSEMLDEEEEKFVNELKEKRKKIHERLKEAEKRYDAEVQRLRDNGLWGHL